MNKLLFFNLNNILWILVIIVMVLIGGYLTLKLGGIQFRLFKMIKLLFKKNNSNSEITAFKTLMLTLAGKIGVGSISGIALGIYLNGPGVLFWIWIISFLVIPIVYAEVYLAMKYRIKTNNNEYNGGVAYYIKNGLNNYMLGFIYSILILFCLFTSFICIQSNTITKSLVWVLNIKPIIIGILLAIIVAFVIFGGIKKIVAVTSKIVPVMMIIYLFLVIFVLIKNITVIPAVFKVIISDAFNYKAFNGGFLATMIIGIQRGIFSCEAGIGTGAIAASAIQDNDMVSQGYIQMIGVYITSFLICTGTGILVILANYGAVNITDPNGIEIAMLSFNYHFGNIGNILLILLIILFAISTILSVYYYGEVSLNYFNNKYVLFLRCILLLVVVLGSVFSATYIWQIIDLVVAILSIINIYAIYKLRNKIKT